MTIKAERALASLAVAALLLSQPGALAATESDAIEKAIRSGGFLGSDVQLSVGEPNKDVVEISIYESKQDTEDALKIQAVLTAKTVMDSNKSVVRVNLNFFDPAKLINYRTVTVTTGDVIAFGKGSEDRKQLLSSLALSPERKISGANVEKYLQLAQTRTSISSVKSTISDDNVLNLSANLSRNADDQDCRFIALQLADRANVALPDAKAFSIVLSNSAEGESKLVRLTTQAVRDAESMLEKALSPIKVQVKGPSSGEAKALAETISKKMDTLSKTGKAPNFSSQLTQAHDLLEKGDERGAVDLLKKLNARLDELLKDSKTGSTGKTGTASAPQNYQFKNLLPPQNSWAGVLSNSYAGGMFIDQSILEAQPAVVITDYRRAIALKKLPPAVQIHEYQKFLQYCAVYFAQKNDVAKANIFLIELQKTGASSGLLR